ncbi:MAG: PEPxxWA-CTERM sorting domain-containing protein [Sphingopyxis sp.]|nr:PEPxxWA-CTERM sorting domain-containing protein [Sphingopyxis sp.]
MPVPHYAGGAAAGTRLYGAMSGIDTPLLFADFAAGDPASIFSNFPAGGGLVIAYSSMGQEDAFTYGNIYPTMTLLRAPILSISSAVPEPGTWAMMLVGFGVIGAAMRNRRRAKRSVGLA